MKKSSLSRSYLFGLTASHVGNYPELFKDPDLVSAVFNDSSAVFSELEKLLEKYGSKSDDKNDKINSNDVKNDFWSFHDSFTKAISVIKTPQFRDYVHSGFDNKLNDKINNDERNSVEYWFSFIASAVAQYQNVIINKNYLVDSFVEYFPNNDKKPRTFLSYAFSDKGLSLSLFFYFLINGGYLYVDWMHNGRIKDPVKLKDTISKAIASSDQFLFIRSAASELKVKGSYSVRQWCSWEIGNFYSINRDAKYLVAFYEPSTSNQILETFQVMDRVENGMIVSNGLVEKGK